MGVRGAGWHPTAFWWGREAGKGRANCAGCDEEFGDKRTAPVGRYPANPWGLDDTAGNVWEWVGDAFSDPTFSPGSSASSSSDPSSKSADAVAVRRVLRGGSWFNDPRYVRAAARLDGGADGRSHGIGFRVCRGSPTE